MQTIELERLLPEQRAWLASQSDLERARRSGGPGVHVRVRAESVGSAIIALAVLGSAALGGFFWLALQTWRHAYAASFGVIALASLLMVAAGYLAVDRVAAVVRAVRSPYVPMWIVTDDALLHVSTKAVTTWPLHSMRQVVLRLRRGGATLVHDGSYIRFGFALAGGLTWMEAGEISKAIDEARGRGVTPGPFSLAGATASPQQWKRQLVIFAAVTVVLTGGLLAFSHLRAVEARRLMEADANTFAAEKAAEQIEDEKAAAAPPPSPTPTTSKSRHQERPAASRPARSGAISAAMPKVNGHIPAEVVDRVVRHNLGALHACYDAGLARNAKLAGKVVVQLTIDGTGAASAAKDAGSSLADGNVVACIVHGFDRMTFGSPGPGLTGVTYTLTLHP